MVTKYDTAILGRKYDIALTKPSLLTQGPLAQTRPDFSKVEVKKPPTILDTIKETANKVVHTKLPTIQDIPARLSITKQAQAGIKSFYDFLSPGTQEEALAAGFLPVKLPSGATTNIDPFGLMGTSGEIRRAASKSVKELVEFFAKEPRVTEIIKTLRELGHPADTVGDTAAKLARTRTVEEVQVVLKELPKIELPKPRVGDEIPKPKTETSQSQLPPQTARLGQQLPLGPTVPKPSPLTPSLPFTVAQHAGGSEQSAFESAFRVLTDALKELKPLEGKQADIYRAERSKRLARSLSVREGAGGGEKGFYAELRQFKGEIPKVEFESLRGKVSQEHIDAMFNATTQTNKLTEFEKLSARGALMKIFGYEGGAVPTKSELDLLAQVFPPELMKTLRAQLPLLSRIGESLLQLLNIPRSLMSSLDLSAPLRQGLFLVGKPKQFLNAFLAMFKQFGSERAFAAVLEEIQSRPTYQLMRESKLAIMSMDMNLTSREERFLSNWAERIPIIGRAVRASGRAYVGFLNKLRADVFDDLLRKAADVGAKGPEVPKNLARFINSATGRGSLGALEASASALNAFFFSPRLMASRFNLLNPMYYIRLDPFTRKEAIKTMLSSGSIIMTVLGLSKMAGAEVGADPRNADFAKARFGNTRLDFAGGLQQYVRLASQLISGQLISSTSGKVLTLGEGYKPLTRLDILIRFFQNKENPIASFVTDFLQGKDAIGRPFELTPAIVNRFIPLFAQDVVETINDWGAIRGIALSAPAIFGVGVQTYDAPTAAEKREIKRRERAKK